MSKICKFLTLIILIVVVLLFGIYQYRTFIQTEIYSEDLSPDKSSEIYV